MPLMSYGVLFNPLARCRAPEKLPKKEFALFELPQGASLQTPASFEERRAPAVGGQVVRAPFLLRSFSLMDEQRKGTPRESTNGPRDSGVSRPPEVGKEAA